MNHEEVFKRPDGSKVMIRVNFWLNNIVPNYDITVYKCEKGKRTWRGTIDTDDYKYRSLSPDDRKTFRREKILEFVTKDEILQASSVIWNKLKPVF